MITWHYVETFQDDEPIICPACEQDVPVKITSKDYVLNIHCACGQELRLHNTITHLHELYAKKETTDEKENTQTTQN